MIWENQAISPNLQKLYERSKLRHEVSHKMFPGSERAYHARYKNNLINPLTGQKVLIKDGGVHVGGKCVATIEHFETGSIRAVAKSGLSYNDMHLTTRGNVIVAHNGLVWLQEEWYNKYVKERLPLDQNESKRIVDTVEDGILQQEQSYRKWQNALPTQWMPTIAHVVRTHLEDVNLLNRATDRTWSFIADGEWSPRRFSLWKRTSPTHK